MKKTFGGVKKVGNSHCLIVISNWLCALCVGLGLGLSCVWFGQQITQRQAAMTRRHGISKAGNSHYTKSTYVSPCVGLCVGLEPERPTPRQCGAMSTKQANCVKMGKGKVMRGNWTAVSQAGVNRPELVGCWFVLINSVVAGGLLLARRGISECSLNDSTHRTHRA